MELWNWIRGWVSVEVISADPVGYIDRCAASGVKLNQIVYDSEMKIRFSICLDQRSVVKKIAARTGADVASIEYHGLLILMKSARKHLFFAGFIMLLVLFTWFLPTRILFLQVEGNETVAAKQILAEAEEQGIGFFTSRSEIRSEVIKNGLLEAIPELQWVGVNTSGCVARITVRERQLQNEPEDHFPGNVVASSDGIIQKIDLSRGELLCEIGQVVEKGQILVSGYKDLGFCNYIVEADAEIYALTNRQIRLVLPVETYERRPINEVIQKMSIIFGKYRINLYQDSGIFMPGYDKMTKVKTLTLPGGWELPIRLVVQEYSVGELIASGREDNDVISHMERFSQIYLRRDMLAGEILMQKFEDRSNESVYCLDGNITATEMISRQRQGIISEGDKQ